MTPGHLDTWTLLEHCRYTTSTLSAHCQYSSSTLIHQQARPPPKDRQQTGQDGWNNVPDRPARYTALAVFTHCTLLHNTCTIPAHSTILSCQDIPGKDRREQAAQAQHERQLPAGEDCTLSAVKSSGMLLLSFFKTYKATVCVSCHVLLPAQLLTPSPQLGPPGGMRPNWGRGSAQMQQKKTSVQVLLAPGRAVS